jgi:hypothetical protein
VANPSGYASAANALVQPIRERALRPVVRSLTSLFSAVAILFVGSGLLGVLTPIRAQIDGFPTVAIGALGTAYYVGFVAGCLYVRGSSSGSDTYGRSPHSQPLRRAAS